MCVTTLPLGFWRHFPDRTNICFTGFCEFSLSSSALPNGRYGASFGRCVITESKKSKRRPTQSNSAWHRNRSVSKAEVSEDVVWSSSFHVTHEIFSNGRENAKSLISPGE